MERKKTLTMNWAGLDDDDDDQFFETHSRISSVDPFDLANSSGSDDDDGDFEDSRMSFSSMASSAQYRHHDLPSFDMSTATTASSPFGSTSPDYNIWMAAPGSIRERRNRLFQEMGLSKEKQVLSFKRIVSKKPEINNNNNQTTSTATATTTQVPLKTVASSKPKLPKPKHKKKHKLKHNDNNNKKSNVGEESSEESKEQPQQQQQQHGEEEEHEEEEEEEEDQLHENSDSQSTYPLPVVLVRSRSDGDIESFSCDKARKEDMIGVISKQRLTRTSSMTFSTHGRIYTYKDSARTANKEGGRGARRGVGHIQHGRALTTMLSTDRIGAFFLIKNLDTGKEFIVNEYNADGNWNKFSDLQTGKQLSMEEFEKSVGYSPVVKELMRRARGHDHDRKFNANSMITKSLRMSKRRGAALLKNIKGVASSMKLSGEKEKEGHSNSNSNNNSNNSKSNPAVEAEQKQNKNSEEWVKVRQTGKNIKELSALHLCQELQAHDGPIWTIKFNDDARFLASAGEDTVIHVWEVQECEIMSMNEGGSLTPLHPSMSPMHPSICNSPDKSSNPPDSPSVTATPEKEKKKKGKNSDKKKANTIPDYVHVPETVFSLSEKPVCSFKGHTDEILDLSWSKSQQLLSSSMDKTVRLWDMETKTCLKLFAHSDYVTCIQFNPVDDNTFISGSLDGKVRIWNIPDRCVRDWIDVHDMVTAACYNPTGQNAMIGSHKGTCRLYSVEDSKLNQTNQTEFTTKKKCNIKKITGFQFSPINPSEVLVTSADSRIRILGASEGLEILHKFRGFRNTSSQIGASFSLNGKFVVCASEDSQVYVWKREEPRNPEKEKEKGKRLTVSIKCHEHFQCRDVSVAIAWPGMVKGDPPVIPVHNNKKQSKRSSTQTPGSPTKEETSKRLLPPLPKKNNKIERLSTPPEDELAAVTRSDSSMNSSSITNSESPSISSATSDQPSFSSAKQDDSNSSSIRKGGHTPSLSSSFSKRHGGDSPSLSSSSSISKGGGQSGHSPSSSSVSSLMNEESGTSSPKSASLRRGDPASSSSLSTSNGGSGAADSSGNTTNQTVQTTAWGLVIVTATVSGEIRTYQNFGVPRRIRQANIF